MKQNDKNGRNLEIVGFPISKKELFWGSENQYQIVRDKIETKLTFLQIWNCPWQVENSEFRIRKKIKLIQPFKEIPEQRCGLLTLMPLDISSLFNQAGETKSRATFLPSIFYWFGKRVKRRKQLWSFTSRQNCYVQGPPTQIDAFQTNIFSWLDNIMIKKNILIFKNPQIGRFDIKHSI